jgi:hypothetical protein
MEGSEGAVSLTPEQVRESITRFLLNVEASDPQKLANELFQEDGEFSELLVKTIPSVISAATEILKSFMESLEGMPAEKSTELLASSLSQVDGKELGETVNAVTSLVIRLHEQNPEFYPEKRLNIAAGVVEEVDFGKLRKALIYRSQERMSLLRNEVEMIGDEPMAIINLFSVITPMINNLFDVLNAALETLTLPSEATAYAVFKILQDIKWQEFASIINGLAGFIIALHRGNLILGDGSLESRAVFARISEDIIANLNPQDVAEAIQAIGEEGEALFSSFIKATLENEELTLWMAGALTMFTNSYLTAAANLLEGANALPQQRLKKVAEDFSEDFEVKELGRVFKNLLGLLGRFRTETPELFGTLLRSALDAAEIEKILSPEGIGSGVNQALLSYNTLCREQPRLVEERLDGFLAAIDPGQLDEAARSTATQVAGAASRHPEVMRPIIKALLSMAYKTTKEYIKSLWSRGARRQGEVRVG